MTASGTALHVRTQKIGRFKTVREDLAALDRQFSATSVSQDLALAMEPICQR
jgi:hypothetical protein